MELFWEILTVCYFIGRREEKSRERVNMWHCFSCWTSPWACPWCCRCSSGCPGCPPRSRGRLSGGPLRSASTCSNPWAYRAHPPTCRCPPSSCCTCIHPTLFSWLSCGSWSRTACPWHPARGSLVLSKRNRHSRPWPSRKWQNRWLKLN